MQCEAETLVDRRLWAAAALAAMFLAACGGDADGGRDTDPTPAEEPAVADTPADDEPDSDAEPPAQLPATGELDGRRLTVEDFGPAVLAFGDPEDGMEVVYIEVTVENVSADPWHSSVFQFFLVDSAGEEYAPELLGSDAGDSFPEVDPLEQGETSTGFVAFQVPPGASLALDYAVDLSVGKTIRIQLT